MHAQSHAQAHTLAQVTPGTPGKAVELRVETSKKKIWKNVLIFPRKLSSLTNDVQNQKERKQAKHERLFAYIFIRDSTNFTFVENKLFIMFNYK